MSAAETDPGRRRQRGIGQVPAVAKAIAIIRFLSAQDSRGASLSAIARSLAITRSHYHGILPTGVAHDWLR